MANGGTILGLSPVWVACSLLVATYTLIVVDRINRSIVALLGGGLMIVFGVLTQREAVRGIDFNTIALLTGMMMLVSIARRSGMFEYVAIWSAQRAKAAPWGILLMLSLSTAVVSALLDNVTTVLLMVPVTLSVARRLRVPPYPFLFAEVMASNIGGTATLIGDPPNIIIGSAANLSFNDFVIHLAPVILIVMAIQLLAIHLVWGRRLHAAPSHRAAVMAMKARETITDWTLLRQSLVVISGVILAFILARRIELRPGTIALFGAAVLLLLDNARHHKHHQTTKLAATYGEVDWITIFFFVGLFIVVHGVETTGVIAYLADRLVAVTRGDLARTASIILWASAVLSAIIDNIPFVAAMVPLIKSMTPVFGTAGLRPLWWALALGACLGGNGTLIGASANLTVAGIAEREGVPFSFMTYTKNAVGLTLISIALSQVYLWLRYF